MLLQKRVFVALLTLLPFFTQAVKGSSDNFIVGLGPVELGKVVMNTSCSSETCNYDVRIKGAFMFIKARINEKGSYKQTSQQILPVSTQYDEKIGSKKRAFTYDFESMEIKDRRKKKQIAMPENVYPFIPLLSQVMLDLKNGGPKQYYEFLSKHKVKRATITAYTKTVTKEGETLHRFTGTEKDEELEFYFLQNGTEIRLQKIAHGSFHLSRAP